MVNNDRIWILMARSLSNEATGEELDELRGLLKDDHELSQQYTMLRKLWSSGTGEEEVSDQEVVERLTFKEILRKGEEERSETDETGAEGGIRKIRRLLFGKSMILLYAAAVVLFLIVYYEPAPAPGGLKGDTRDVVAAQNGSKTKILLPDGTTVWLNGDSKLFYDKEFSGARREVSLEGEAFFDVVKDPKRPFIVHAGSMNIRVLGTAFNVKYYKEDQNFETTLLRGKIAVSDQSDKTSVPVYLEPNQKLIVPVKVIEVKKVSRSDFKIEKLDLKLKDNERIETAWIYNRIQFRGDNFEELARKLERWYNVEIEFGDDSVKHLRFNGSFEKETVEEAFSALQKVAPFNYKIYGREVFIKSSE